MDTLKFAKDVIIKKLSPEEQVIFFLKFMFATLVTTGLNKLPD